MATATKAKAEKQETPKAEEAKDEPKAPAKAAEPEAPALNNNVRGDIQREPGRPTANEMQSALREWASGMRAGGATEEDLETALKDFKLEGSLVGEVESAKGPVGQWGVDVHPADWEPGDPPLA